MSTMRQLLPGAAGAEREPSARVPAAGNLNPGRLASWPGLNGRPSTRLIDHVLCLPLPVRETTHKGQRCISFIHFILLA